ncbi:MAG: hypothetical protein HYR51_01835 [Candidatus Rokubacteria bacterium]|nr:hypothetical protein [Candidatus Rokubacteria bacterium]
MIRRKAMPKSKRPVSDPARGDNTVHHVFGCMSGTATIAGNVEQPVVRVGSWHEISRDRPGRAKR